MTLSILISTLNTLSNCHLRSDDFPEISLRVYLAKYNNTKKILYICVHEELPHAKEGSCGEV